MMWAGEPDPDNAGGGKCRAHNDTRLRGLFREGVFFEEEGMNKPEASLAIQVLPQSVSGDKMLGIIDKVIAYLKLSGLNMAVGPFETVIEGDFEELMELAAECQRICVREGAEGLLTYMKMAYNPHDGVLPIEKKIAKYTH
jgi:uncharacterized protein YqgV (UPF0045/DUF77 family)